MRPISLAIRGSSVLLASCLFAACSGGQSTGVVPQGSNPASLAQSQNAQSAASQPARAPESQGVQSDAGNCKTTGKHVTADPCIVAFSVLQLEPVKVKIKARRNAEISEKDNCGGLPGIAEITVSGGDRTYMVSPGLLPGSCKATFKATHGKKTYGTATVNISQTLL
jgi:hypothetical protein